MACLRRNVNGRLLLLLMFNISVTRSRCVLKSMFNANLLIIRIRLYDVLKNRDFWLSEFFGQPIF